MNRRSCQVSKIKDTVDPCELPAWLQMCLLFYIQKNGRVEQYFIKHLDFLSDEVIDIQRTQPHSSGIRSKSIFLRTFFCCSFEGCQSGTRSTTSTSFSGNPSLKMTLFSKPTSFIEDIAGEFLEHWLSVFKVRAFPINIFTYKHIYLLIRNEQIFHQWSWW